MPARSMWTRMLYIEHCILNTKGTSIYGRYVRDRLIYTNKSALNPSVEPSFNKNINVFTGSLANNETLIDNFKKNNISIKHISKPFSHEHDSSCNTVTILLSYNMLDVSIRATFKAAVGSTWFYIDEPVVASVDCLYITKESSKDYDLKLLENYKFKNKCFGKCMYTLNLEILGIINSIHAKCTIIFEHDKEIVGEFIGDGWKCRFDKQIIFSNSSDYELCTLCLSDFADIGGSRNKCCNAHYHDKCYITIMSKMSVCPVCRIKF